ncbi:MAG TPA: AMP-binding protein [Nocardioidaceae bacterium]|nr:AMP-binding protein [Nocardioidaceae bacterium]
MASLQPISGPPREVHAALRAWAGGADAAQVLVRTSGSTGEPKDVLLSRPAMLASARAALTRLGGPGQWLLALPAHYVAGAQVLLRSVLSDTEPVLLAEHADLTAALGAMDSRVRRYVSLVPTQLHRMLDEHAEALAAFDAVLLGGASAAPRLLERARRAGVRVVTTYGMSETCGGCVYDGVPLDGVGVRIGGDGRVHLLGPVLFDGYAGRPDLTRGVLVDGELRTPDVGRLDDDGRLVVLGRADDVVVSGGVNVALPAVERRLREHPDVVDTAVLGIEDPEWGCRVVAAVVAPAPGLGELRDFVGMTLPRSWAPRQLLVVDALPMLESGKVDRAALRRML